MNRTGIGGSTTHWVSAWPQELKQQIVDDTSSHYRKSDITLAQSMQKLKTISAFPKNESLPLDTTFKTNFVRKLAKNPYGYLFFIDRSRQDDPTFSPTMFDIKNSDCINGKYLEQAFLALDQILSSSTNYTSCNADIIFEELCQAQKTVINSDDILNIHSTNTPALSGPEGNIHLYYGHDSMETFINQLNVFCQ